MPHLCGRRFVIVGARVDREPRGVVQVASRHRPLAVGIQPARAARRRLARLDGRRVVLLDGGGGWGLAFVGGSAVSWMGGRRPSRASTRTCTSCRSSRSCARIAASRSRVAVRCSAQSSIRSEVRTEAGTRRGEGRRQTGGHDGGRCDRAWARPDRTLSLSLLSARHLESPASLQKVETEAHHRVQSVARCATNFREALRQTKEPPRPPHRRYQA